MTDGGTEQLDLGLLRRAVLALELSEEHTKLCRLMAWWTVRGNPPIEAMLAHARTLIAIRQMDSAWQVLREAAAAFPERFDVKLLTAELLIERGWTTRARQFIAEIGATGEQDPRLRSLEERLVRPLRDLPANAREVERLGTVTDRLELAELYLLRGSALRARSLLEGIVADGYTSRRVDDLLAGIRKDFGALQGSQAEVLSELLGWPVSGLEIPEIVEHEDVTEPGLVDSASLEGLPVGKPYHDGVDKSFPELFRSATADSVSDDLPDEGTESSILASLEEMADPPTEEGSLGGPMDTQIMEIISSNDGVRVRPVSGEIHRISDSFVDEGTEVEWANTLDVDSTVDDDIVVLAEQSGLVEPPVETERTRVPIQVFEKYPTPVRGYSAFPEEPEPASESDEAGERRSAEESDEVLEDDFFRHRRKKNRLRLLVLLILVSIGLIFVWERGFPEAESESLPLLDELVEVLESGDPRLIREVADQWRFDVQTARAPVSTRAVGWGILEFVLYVDYTGNPAGLISADRARTIAEEHGVADSEHRLLDAARYWVMGDLEAAYGAVEDADTGELRGYLSEQIELERSSAWGYDGRPREAPTGAASFARWINHHPDASAVRGTRARINLALAELNGTDTDRLRSNLLLAASRQQESEGEHGMELVEQALSTDSNNPEALLLMGEYAWAERAWTDSLSAFEECLEHRAADVRCLRGLILTYMEMDDVDAISDRISGWMADSEIPLDLMAWHLLLRGEDTGLLDDDKGVRLVIQLDQLHRGVSMQVDSSDMAEAMAANSPVIRRLLRRFYILSALSAERMEEVSNESDWSTESDPWILLGYVRTASLHEAEGEGLEGLESRMDEYATGSARLLYELGTLRAEEDAVTAVRVWDQYSSLNPSGPRADEVGGIGR